MSKKKRMVDGEEPRLQLSDNLTAKLLLDLDRYENGSMLMKFEDTHIEVSDSSGQIGSIGMAIGGTLYVELQGRTWSIDIRELFSLVRNAESVQYLGVVER